METIISLMQTLGTWQEVFFKFLLSVVLAGAVGLERERKGRAAGLRTHVLVCLGATLSMVVADLLAREWAAAGAPVWLDKGRIAAGVITGVGFLGAGTIVVVGGASRGLTTAATIWFVAALGIAIGAGFAGVAVCATAFALAVTIGFKYVERRLPSEDEFSLHVRMRGGAENVDKIEDLLRKSGHTVAASRLRVASDEPRIEVSFTITSKQRADLDELTRLLEARLENIEQITFER